MKEKTDKTKKAQEPEIAEKEKTEKKNKKAKKTPKWLVVTVSVILGLVLAAAVFVLGIYRGMNLWVNAELGEGAPDAAAFVKNESAKNVEYVGSTDISLTEEGTYLLTVDNDGAVRKVVLIVKDTQAPKAKSADVKITIDDTIEPQDALTDIYDASDYTVEWKTAPEFGEAGEYTARIKLTDAYENSSVIKAKVTVLGAIDRLVMEAGDARPTLKDFMVVERENAELVTDMSSIEWNVPGENEVEVSFDGETYTSILEIVDTVAPVPDKIVAATLKDSKIEASAFTLGFDDATAVESKFVSEPDVSKTGEVSCKIAATDLGGNTTEFDASLIVADRIFEVEAENKTMTEGQIRTVIGTEYAGCTIDPEASDIDFEVTELGAHAISLTKLADNSKIIIAIVVKDTTAPTAEGIECPCSTGYYCEPIKFVTNIVDMSAVKASFDEEPDWSTEGTQDVVIKLTDRSGNVARIEAKAVISPDKTAPVIYAAKDTYCYVGDAVAYFKEVFAEDNADPEPEITVDKSKVDAKKAGTYDVTYTATDAEGNSSSVTVKYTFVDKTVTEEQLKEAVNAVTAKIFKDGMSESEKALAIFNYCYDNITYWGDSNKTDLYGEAYRGLTEGQGDCYTFYATTYVLLQEIDAQVLSVERMNGKTQHFWCLVNLGSGWYHFDTCNVGPQHYKCFMKMNSDLAPLSPQYWVFNEALYPAVATTPFVMK